MELIYHGKTKDIYQNDENSIVLKFKDDLTGSDGEFDPGANQIGLSIDGMGQLNLKLTSYFFDLLNKAGIPTHFIESNVPENAMTVKKAEVFGQGIEVITRFKATGSFIRRYGAYIEDGSTLKDYFEITLKDDDREDPLITKAGILALNIMSENQYQTLVELNHNIAYIIKEELEKYDLDLYDIKLEFGYIKDSNDIILIDEISGGNMRVYKENHILGPVELAQIFVSI